MADISIDPAQFAQAMANRVVRERKRIAQRIEEYAASVTLANSPGIQVGLYALAEEIRTGGVPVPALPEREPIAEQELPAVHHMDDFEQGVAMVRGRALRPAGGARD